MIAIYLLALLGAWTLLCAIVLAILFGRELRDADREYAKHIEALREHAADSIPTS